MPILVQCPNPECGVTSRADESVEGRNVRCKKCGRPFVAQPTLDGLRSDTKKGRPTSPSASDPFPVLPAEFGRYRVLRLLGKGGMGAVYLAADTQLRREVALKIPFFDALGAPDRVERFVREARSAAALQHPGICTVFDAGQIDGRPFITMAFVPGTPLDGRIDPDSPMPQVEAAGIARRIALALEHAHGKGIVHRDLKPANVMIAADGDPVVMDFGLAKQVADVDPGEAKLTRDGGILGTPSYMSPEQVRGDNAKIGAATDVYSLGVVLFQMLSGRVPYTGSLGVVMGQILSAPAPPVGEFRPEVDLRLDVICRKAMAKDPAKRYASMAEMAHALDRFLNSSANAATIPSAEPPKPVRKPAPTITAIPQAIPLSQATVEAEAANRTPADPFARLDDGPTASTATDRDRGRTRPPRRLLLAAALLVPLLAVLGAVVFRVESADGTLVVEMNDAEVEAKIKNGKLVLTGPDGVERYTLAPGDRNKKIDAGAYKIRVDGADGLSVDVPEFVLKKGDKVTVRVTAVTAAAAKKEAAKGIPDPSPADERGWISLTSKGLGEWQQDGDDWMEVGDAGLDPKDAGRLVTRPGAGTVVSATAGKGARNLTSRRLFGDVEVRAEFNVPKAGNSGLFFLAHYELQVCDSWGGGGPKLYDCGGVFPCALNGGPYPGFGVAPKQNASRPAGEWQTFEATFRTPRYDAAGRLTSPARFARVVHNGRPIHEDSEVATPAPPKPGPGPLVLQGGFGAIAWRNVRVRPIPGGAAVAPPTVAPPMPPEPKFEDKGFVPLFDGKTLAGWTVDSGTRDRWKVEDGQIKTAGLGSASRGWLLSEKQYENFILVLEFQTTEGADGGVGFRAIPGNTMRNLPHQPGIKLTGHADPKMPRSGALYHSQNVWQGPDDRSRPTVTKGWTSLTLRVQGDSVQVNIDGVRVQNFRPSGIAKLPDAFPNFALTTGRIGLQQVIGEVRFRDIQIKELPPTK